MMLLARRWSRDHIKWLQQRAQRGVVVTPSRQQPRKDGEKNERAMSRSSEFSGQELWSTTEAKAPTLSCDGHLAIVVHV